MWRNVYNLEMDQKQTPGAKTMQIWKLMLCWIAWITNLILQDNTTPSDLMLQDNTTPTDFMPQDNTTTDLILWYYNSYQPTNSMLQEFNSIQFNLFI